MLQGAPLAYTPFCDNNKDMDGFRFWKQGFWKDHLRGHPYHISALYVVDLARFRCATVASWEGLWCVLRLMCSTCQASGAPLDVHGRHCNAKHNPRLGS